MIVLIAEPPPNYGCGEDPPLGSDQEQAVTLFRALAFSMTGLIAIAVGVMAARWSRERRVRRGHDARPGIPTLLAAVLPVLLFALVLLEPNEDGSSAVDPLLVYFIYGAFGGFFIVPALAIAALVLSFVKRLSATERARANVEAATIGIADLLIVFGLPLAITFSYLQGGGPLFC